MWARVKSVLRHLIWQQIPPPTSTIENGNLHFEWNIPNFVKLDTVQQYIIPEATMTDERNYRWEVQIRPKESRQTDSTDVVCLKLKLLTTPEPELRVGVTLSIVGRNGDHLNQWSITDWVHQGDELSVVNFVTWNDLKDMTKGLLQMDGSFVLKGDIVLVDYKPRMSILPQAIPAIMSTPAAPGPSFDVVIISVGDDTYDVQRSVLEGASSKFREMLQDAERDGDTGRARVSINQATIESVRFMADYLATGQLEDFAEQGPNMLRLGNQFGLQELMEEVEERMAEHIDANNAVEYFLIADLYGCQKLRHQSMHFIRENLSEVKATPKWHVLSNSREDLFHMLYPEEHRGQKRSRSPLGDAGLSQKRSC